MIEPLIHHFNTVSSTNDVAMKMALAGEPEGTVVLADMQTNGRGRRGKNWINEPGKSVLMSIVLRPKKMSSELSQISFVASLSVYDTLIKLGLKPMLKWPNDVYVNEKKITGILLETAHQNEDAIVVIGIGININQTSFPDAVSSFATSVAIERKIQVDIDLVTNFLIESLSMNYEKYLLSGFEEILARWTKYMWGTGSKVDIISGEQNIYGEIIGLDKSGALVIKNSSGVLEKIIAADAMNLRISKK